MTTPQRRLRVLVADDYLDTREALCLLVTHWGHDCKPAADGAEALALAAAFFPEVVLLDVAMPGVDGYEVARRVRQALARWITSVGRWTRDSTGTCSSPLTLRPCASCWHSGRPHAGAAAG